MIRSRNAWNGCDRIEKDGSRATTSAFPVDNPGNRSRDTNTASSNLVVFSSSGEY